MRKELTLIFILFGVFLAIGCTGNKSETPNNTVPVNNAVTPATSDYKAGMMSNGTGMMGNRTEIMENRTGMMENRTGMTGNRP